jgi:hypothetical protein
LREKRRLGVFGPKKDEVTGEWRELHNEKLYYLNSSPTIVRVIKSKTMRWVGYVALMGERRGVHRVLVGKTEGNRPKRRWEENINIVIQEVGCGVMGWL